MYEVLELPRIIFIIFPNIQLFKLISKITSIPLSYIQGAEVTTCFNSIGNKLNN